MSSVQYTLSDGSIMKLLDCPVNLITPAIWGYLRAYEEHVAGRPWYGGPPASWPRKYTVALNRIAAERQRQAKRKAERDKQAEEIKQRMNAPLRRRLRG